MNLPSIKDLDKIILLCRKRGVKSITIDNVKIELSEEAPPSQYKKRQVDHNVEESGNSVTVEGELTEEELLFYSAGPAQE